MKDTKSGQQFMIKTGRSWYTHWAAADANDGIVIAHCGQTFNENDTVGCGEAQQGDSIVLCNGCSRAVQEI